MVLNGLGPLLDTGRAILGGGRGGGRGVWPEEREGTTTTWQTMLTSVVTHMAGAASVSCSLLSLSFFNSTSNTRVAPGGILSLTP